MTSAESTVDVAAAGTSTTPSNRVEVMVTPPAVDPCADRGGPGQSGGPAVLDELDRGDVVRRPGRAVDPAKPGGPKLLVEVSRR